MMTTETKKTYSFDAKVMAIHRGRAYRNVENKGGDGKSGRVNDIKLMAKINRFLSSACNKDSLSKWLNA